MSGLVLEEADRLAGTHSKTSECRRQTDRSSSLDLRFQTVERAAVFAKTNLFMLKKSAAYVVINVIGNVAEFFTSYDG
jgi:hypothetical protein